MRFIPRRPLCVALAFGLLGPFNAPAAELTGTAQDRLKKDIQYLASDELEGRSVGSQGLDLAATYLKQNFAAAGLKVNVIDGEPFQKFTMVTAAKLQEGNTLTLSGPEGKSLKLEIGKDCQVLALGGSAKFSGELAFVGYAMHAKDIPYNDFEGLDLKGKVVVALRRNPQQDNQKSPFRSVPHLAGLQTKISACASAGAVAVLFVNDPHSLSQETEKLFDNANNSVIKAAKEITKLEPTSPDFAKSREALTAALKKIDDAAKVAHAGGDDPLLAVDYAGPRAGKDDALPVFHITAAKVNEILQATVKKSLKDIEAEIDARLKPQSAVLTGWSAAGETHIERVRSEVKNVIAVLDGEGPLADETIVVGAHYDHVGRGGEGSLAGGSKEIHNGADDNASGSVSLLEVARRLAARPQKLPRRVVFIAFTAEELGLLGSAKYVEQPVFPLDKTIAMFNMDMVGRLTDNTLTVYGIGTSPTFKDSINKFNETREFRLVLKPEGQGPSDQTSFYLKKIPVLHFFTGTHSDYHRPGDDWDKINIDGMSRITSLVEDFVVQTAMTEKRPEYLEVKGHAQIARAGNRPYVGTIPNFGSEEKGYAISGATAGSPADVAGMKGGDRIIQVGPHKVTDLNDFDSALRNFNAGDVVEFVAIRDGKEAKFNVKLSAPR